MEDVCQPSRPLGVLFLNELPEFQRGVLDSLRQPIKTGEAVVAHANAHVRYPARFQLVAAITPCRCGYLGDPALGCGRGRRVKAAYCRGAVLSPDHAFGVMPAFVPFLLGGDTELCGRAERHSLPGVGNLNLQRTWHANGHAMAKNARRG